MSVLARARAGLSGVDVPEAVRAAAVRNLELWWTGAPFAAYREPVQALVDGGRFEELADAFRQVLPFGTGGRRGAVGVGPNRINPFTVATCVEGHVRWLRTVFPQKGTLRVVVAYDVRRFVDARGVYGGRSGPLAGLSSRDFAEIAARVYAGRGVEVHLLRRGASWYLSTPELSFTIRALGAQGGLNLSASHNPPDDNGVKVYDHRGGQLAPPEDQDLLDVVASVEDAQVPSWEEAVATGLVQWLEPTQHRAYVEAVAAVAPPGPRGLDVLYTPLHGTGAVGEVLQEAGFACRVHAPQATPDGAFPTVPNGVANPEQPEAMAHALAAAGGADLVLGTDPDADRIGAEVRHRGGFVHLSGNDIAALVVVAALRRDVGGKRPLVVQTEVTSSLVPRIARAAGAAVVDDLLVGFKYVADVLRRLEEEGRYEDLRADEVVFVCGAEESHGVLVTDRMRDKDAAGGAVLLAALAAEARRDGRTLVDVLDHLRGVHGYVLDGQVSLQYPGATGQQRLAELLDRLRAGPPTAIGARGVLDAVDHRDEGGRFGRLVSESDRVARNVLVYRLAAGPSDEGARVILRPSGTEPKLKVYLEVLGRPGLDDAGRAAVDAELASLRDAVRGWLG